VAPGEVELEPWRPRAWAIVALAVILAGVAAGGLAALFVERGPFGEYEYQLWRWEADTFLDSAFTVLAIGPEPAAEEGAQAIRRYFALTSEMQALLGSAEPDLDRLDRLEADRARDEATVERYIERTIASVAKAEGLQRALPFFERVRVTWPPVNMQLTSPPRLLVRSPRTKIDRLGDTLLQPDLSVRQVEAIEREADGRDTVSIVVNLGGIAAYPAMVRDDRSYDAVLETAAHEWVHHYLAFEPLGEQWGRGGDAGPLNETTANIAGRAIADLIEKAHPVELPAGANGEAPPAPRADVDFGKEMRALRLEVDALLAEGKVAEAEQAMEAKRQFLASKGIFIRRLNQAYFAFYGTYADTPASSNPIGPKIQQVWELTHDVGQFLAVMREVRNTRDLDASLEALSAGRR
jgi:hypothetical protein